MKLSVFAALMCVAILCGCGHSANPRRESAPPGVGPQSQTFVEPESAYTPEGAKPAPAPPPTVTLVPGERSIDSAGLNLVGGFEGFSSCPYQDIVGVWTIGYGVTSGSGIFVGPHTPCESRTTGLAQLATLIRRDYEPAVHAVSLTFGQNAINGLDSFAYNLGAGIFTGSLRSDLAHHDYRAACSLMVQYDHAGGRVIEGLRIRRDEECRVIQTPDFNRAALLARQRTLRRVLLRDGCRRRRQHHERLGPKCRRWFAEGARVDRELA